MLDGLTVVEAGDTVAAAAAGALCVKLGARVVKETDTSKTARGRSTQRDRLLELLDRGKTRTALGEDGIPSTPADVTIVDLTASPLRRDSAGIERYRELVGQRNTGVWVTVSPFGLSGPLSCSAGDELVAVASGGMANYTRTSVGRPMKPAGFAASVTAGHYAVLAGLHGLLRRDEGARSTHLDLSLQDTIIVTGVFLECAHKLFECSGEGGAARYAAPRGLVPCGTGFIWIVVLEDHQWRGCVEAMGSPPWTAGIDDAADRQREHEAVQNGLAAWASQYPAREVAERLQACGVPATPVNSPADLLAGVGSDVRDGFFVPGERPGEIIPDLPFVRIASAGAPAPPDAGARRHRVLDLTQVLVGPLATSWLGTMGIDVLKVEDPDRVDVYRRHGPFLEDEPGLERSAYFAFANYSKRSHAVSLSSSEGRERLERLVATADVVVHNLVQRAVGLGLTPEHAHGELGAFVVSCSGYGRTTRYAAHRAYGMNIQAAGGVVDLTRDRNGRPVNLGTSWADPLSSIWIAIVTVAQLLRPPHERTSVDISMVEAVAYEFGEYFSALTADEIMLGTAESRLDHAAPHGIYCARGEDRWLALSVESDEAWQALVDVLGRPAALDRPGWASFAGRAADHDELDGALDELMRGYDGWELFEQLQAAGVACVPVLRAADIVALEHLRVRGLFQTVTHPVWGERPLIGLPWLVDDQPAPIAATPVLGCDTTDDETRWWQS